MLRPKVYSRLAEVGLDHLANRPATLTRGGAHLHALPHCPDLVHWTSQSPVRETLTTSIRNLPPHQVCSCVSSATSAPFGAFHEAVGLLSALLALPPGPVPSGTSIRVLQALARRVGAIEAVLGSYFFTRVTDPEVRLVRDRLEEELDVERSLLLQRIRSSGATAVLLQDAAIACTWGGDLSEIWPTLTGVVGPNGAAGFVDLWALLVDRGVDRDGRRRRLSAFLGSVLLRNGTADRDVLRSSVQEALAALDVLEARLESLLASPPPLSLRACTYSANDPTGYERLVLESFHLARRGGWWLLAAPDRPLERAGSFESRPHRRRRDSEPVPVPGDPRHLETVVSLWDPSSGGQFSTPRGALEAAILV